MVIGRVLGPTEVEAGGRLVDLGGPLPRRMVTALLVAEGRPVGEESLAETIWAGAPPASFSGSLQAYASRLRRALGPARDALRRSGDGYLLVAETDAAHFAEDVARGRRLLDADRPAEALRAFDAALARWRGDAYADLADDPSAAAARAGVTELRAVASEERLAALLAVGDAPGAVGALQFAVREEPYRERRWELLIVALYRSGRQADALAAARRVRSRLAGELGIDPGPALQRLEARVLAQDPSLLLPARPPVPRAAAPLNRPLSRFLGRRAELAQLVALAPATRLVTLVGPGGAGKTRLAVEFAAGSGPWFVRLADVSEPALVAAAVADAAGVHADTAEALSAALGDRPGLLVLCRLMLARALLRASPTASPPAPADPAAAVRALCLAVRQFAEEDDVGNVLSTLLAGAHALLLLGRAGDGTTLAAAVRREAARRGLVFEPADPIGAAALDEALAATGLAGGGAELDRAAMIALLDTGARE